MPNIKKLMNDGIEYLVQEPLVSGTNIKTVGGESVLGSGNISTNSSLTVTLASNGWDANNQQTVTAVGVTANNNIVVSPAPASFDSYSESGIRAISQAANSITFEFKTEPSDNLTVNIIILK